MKTTPAVAAVDSSELKKMLNLQRAAEKAKQTVATLKSAIAEREGRLQQILAAASAPTDFQSTREDLRAAAALGQITETDVVKREAEMLKQETAATAAAKAVQTSAEPERITILGLQRKLAAAEASLESAEAALTPALEELLIAEAERICVGYIEEAYKLKATYLQLMAINAILQSRAGGRSAQILNTSTYMNLSIPTFALEACKGLGQSSYDHWGTLVNAQHWSYSGAVQDDATDEEFERLIGLGVDIESSKHERAAQDAERQRAVDELHRQRKLAASNGTIATEAHH